MPGRFASIFTALCALVVVSSSAHAGDSAARRRGLLGRDHLPPEAALIIAPSNAIHMFGMRFAIDVLFVSRAGRVLKRVVALGRRRVAFSPRAFAVVELAAHHEGVGKTEVGDVLAISAGV